MAKEQKSKRTIDDIGKRRYDFDYQLEKAIYKNLCCMHLSNSEEKKIRIKKDIMDIKNGRMIFILSILMLRNILLRN